MIFFFDHQQLYIVLFTITDSNRCNRQSAGRNTIFYLITCGRWRFQCTVTE